MKKFLAVAAVAAGALMMNAPAASADSYALINGDLAPCALAPWNWEGFVDIVTTTGEYNACQKFNVSHG